jgi:pimeloyl-ACP methyl ester carboxylesterase
LGAGLASAQVRQSMRRTQLLQWETCRNGGFQVPVQVIWAAQDPLASRAANYLLFSTIAEKQRSAQFHIVNRSGSLPFLEQPEIFFEMVAAWQDGVAAEFS